MRAARADRAAITVTTNPAVVGIGPTMSDWQLAIEAHNSGRRPITIVAAGLDLATGMTVPVTYGGGELPKRLQEGESVRTWLKAHDIAKIHRTPGEGPVTRAWVRDAGGRQHYDKRSDWSMLDVFAGNPSDPEGEPG